MHNLLVNHSIEVPAKLIISFESSVYQHKISTFSQLFKPFDVSQKCVWEDG